PGPPLSLSSVPAEPLARGALGVRTGRDPHRAASLAGVSGESLEGGHSRPPTRRVGGVGPALARVPPLRRGGPHWLAVIRSFEGGALGGLGGWRVVEDRVPQVAPCGRARRRRSPPSGRPARCLGRRGRRDSRGQSA